MTYIEPVSPYTLDTTDGDAAVTYYARAYSPDPEHPFDELLRMSTQHHHSRRAALDALEQAVMFSGPTEMRVELWVQADDAASRVLNTRASVGMVLHGEDEDTAEELRSIFSGEPDSNVRAPASYVQPGPQSITEIAVPGNTDDAEDVGIASTQSLGQLFEAIARARGIPVVRVGDGADIDSVLRAYADSCPCDDCVAERAAKKKGALN